MNSTNNYINRVVIGSGVTSGTPTGFTLQGTSGFGTNIYFNRVGPDGTVESPKHFFPRYRATDDFFVIQGILFTLLPLLPARPVIASLLIPGKPVMLITKDDLAL